MPYVKKQETPYVRVRRLLMGYGLDPCGLAAVLGCSRNTAAARLANPGTLTLSELGTISRAGHIPMDEIRQAIIY